MQKLLSWCFIYTEENKNSYRPAKVKAEASFPWKMTEKSTSVFVPETSSPFPLSFCHTLRPSFRWFDIFANSCTYLCANQNISKSL